MTAAGYRVRALVRRPEAATLAAACGAGVVPADLFDEVSQRAGLAGCLGRRRTWGRYLVRSR